MDHPAGDNKVPGCARVSEEGEARSAHSLRTTLLMLGPLDALEVNAILHHLPEGTVKEKRHTVREGGLRQGTAASTGTEA